VKGYSEDRAAAFENIGAALAVLRRLNSLCLDDDVYDEATHARQLLSVAQSRIHERIQASKQGIPREEDAR
jgi:hypothetical protein